MPENGHDKAETPKMLKKPRRRTRGSGTVSDVKRHLWEAITDAERLLRSTTDPKLRLRCTHAIATAGGVYAKVVEASELEQRIQRLEDIMKKRQQLQDPRYYGTN